MLKNTDWMMGIVLFVGPDTRSLMNAGVSPSKRSKIERLMNIQVNTREWQNPAVLIPVLIDLAQPDHSMHLMCDQLRFQLRL